MASADLRAGDTPTAPRSCPTCSSPEANGTPVITEPKGGSRSPSRQGKFICEHSPRRAPAICPVEHRPGCPGWDAELPRRGHSQAQGGTRFPLGSRHVHGFHAPACRADLARLGGGCARRGQDDSGSANGGPAPDQPPGWSTCLAEATKVDGSRASSLRPRCPHPRHRPVSSHYLVYPPSPAGVLPSLMAPSHHLACGLWTAHVLLRSVPPGGPKRRLPPLPQCSSSRVLGRAVVTAALATQRLRDALSQGRPQLSRPLARMCCGERTRHDRPSRCLTCCCPRAPLSHKPGRSGPAGNGRRHAPRPCPRGPQGRPHTRTKHLFSFKHKVRITVRSVCVVFSCKTIQGRKKDTVSRNSVF